MFYAPPENYDVKVQPWLTPCPHCGYPSVRAFGEASDPINRVRWTDGRITEKANRAGVCGSCFKVVYGSFETDRELITSKISRLLISAKGRQQPENVRRSMRLKVWRLGNDLRRFDNRPNAPLQSNEENRNLLALYKLLSRYDPIERIYKAEIKRQLSQFEEAITLLRIRPVSRYRTDPQDHANTVLNLANARVSKVLPIDKPGQLPRSSGHKTTFAKSFEKLKSCLKK
jgi:hypothetical protein